MAAGISSEMTPRPNSKIKFVYGSATCDGGFKQFHTWVRMFEHAHTHTKMQSEKNVGSFGGVNEKKIEEERRKRSVAEDWKMFVEVFKSFVWQCTMCHPAHWRTVYTTCINTDFMNGTERIIRMCRNARSKFFPTIRRPVSNRCESGRVNSKR